MHKSFFSIHPSVETRTRQSNVSLNIAAATGCPPSAGMDSSNVVNNT